MTSITNIPALCSRQNAVKKSEGAELGSRTACLCTFSEINLKWVRSISQFCWPRHLIWVMYLFWNTDHLRALCRNKIVWAWHQKWFKLPKLNHWWTLFTEPWVSTDSMIIDVTTKKIHEHYLGRLASSSSVKYYFRKLPILNRCPIVISCCIGKLENDLLLLICFIDNLLSSRCTVMGIWPFEGCRGCVIYTRENLHRFLEHDSEGRNSAVTAKCCVVVATNFASVGCNYLDCNLVITRAIHWAIQTKAHHKYPSVTTESDSVTCATVTPSTLNLLKATYGLLLSCQTTSRPIQELHRWFWVDSKMKKQTDHLFVSKDSRLCSTACKLFNTHEGKTNHIQGSRKHISKGEHIIHYELRDLRQQRKSRLLLRIWMTNNCAHNAI